MARSTRIWATALAMSLLIAVGIATLVFPAWQHRIKPPDDRVAPFTLDAPKRTFNITLVGTSLTSRLGWPEALETSLAECLGLPVSITRVARAGMNSSWGVRQIPAILASAPDLVTVEFSGNDADIYDGISLRQSDANHRRLIEELRGATPDLPIVLMIMSPKYGLPAVMRPLLPRYLALYPKLSAEMNTGLIDFYPRWLERPWEERGLQSDGQHPDPGIATEVIVPLLVAHIAAAAGRSCMKTAG